MNYEVLTSNMSNLDKDWATKKAQSVKVCFKDSIYLHSVLSTWSSCCSFAEKRTTFKKIISLTLQSI